MRKTARLLLKNKWLCAALVTATVFFVMAVSLAAQLFLLPEKLTLVFSVVFSLLIIAPLVLGYKRWCIRLEPQRRAPYTTVFHYFTTPKRYLRAVVTELVVLLHVTLTAVVTALPAGICLALSSWLKLQPQNELLRIFSKNCTTLGIIAIPIFLVLFFIFAPRSLAVSYMVANDDSLGIIRAFKRSSLLSKNNLADVVKTLFPITVLFPACLLIIPAFVLTPYAVTVFSQCVKRFEPL